MLLQHYCSLLYCLTYLIYSKEKKCISSLQVKPLRKYFMTDDFRYYYMDIFLDFQDL